MLKIKVECIPDQSGFNEEKEEFYIIPGTKGGFLRLEHSLLSLKKWESKWKKPFLSKETKTAEEFLDYIRCMCLDEDVDETLFNHLSEKNISDIYQYINDTMTATWFSKNPMDQIQGNTKEAITAEIIYYWMVALNIPSEYQKWHLNQLLTLIKVVSVKNQPPKKMSPKEAARRRATLNAARRAKYHTRG